MLKTLSYGFLLIGIFLVNSLNSWGSVSLPQLSFTGLREGRQVSFDTIPANAPAVQDQQPPQATTETVVQPVIRQVPKSRKRVKPATVTPKVKVPPTKIIKPKIVIKKINVNVP